jgi:hypothetical protein
MLAVVGADVAQEGTWPFQRRRFGARPEDLRLLPVWQELEGRFHLELAQALSNRGRRGRESDFRDAERLVRRYAADELSLSFVPIRNKACGALWRGPNSAGAGRNRGCRVEALLEGMDQIVERSRRSFGSERQTHACSLPQENRYRLASK